MYHLCPNNIIGRVSLSLSLENQGSSHLKLLIDNDRRLTILKLCIIHFSSIHQLLSYFFIKRLLLFFIQFYHSFVFFYHKLLFLRLEHEIIIKSIFFQFKLIQIIKELCSLIFLSKVGGHNDQWPNFNDSLFICYRFHLNLKQLQSNVGHIQIF